VVEKAAPQEGHPERVEFDMDVVSLWQGASRSWKLVSPWKERARATDADRSSTVEVAPHLHRIRCSDDEFFVSFLLFPREKPTSGSEKKMMYRRVIEFGFLMMPVVWGCAGNRRWRTPVGHEPESTRIGGRAAPAGGCRARSAI
jgi:hypothetical protein